MRTSEKERVCKLLKGIFDITPVLDPRQTLDVLARPQYTDEADIRKLLDKADLMASHLYEHRHAHNLNVVRERLTRQEIFRMGYVPFVIAELVWDYADTIICTASRLGASASRKLSRAIRQLKERYDRKRFHFIGLDEREREVDNGQVFERVVQGYADQLLMHIRLALDNECPNLEADWRRMFTAVYQCHVLSRALIAYTEEQERKTAAKLGQNLFHVLPAECYGLDGLILEYLGDMPPSARFRATLEQYVRTFAAQMGRMEFEDENENQYE